MCSTGDGSEAGRREGYLYSEAGCGWRREYGSRAGRVSFKVRDKMWFVFQVPE